MANTLEIDSVIKSFAGKQVLTDIYLKCSSGDIIGLIGRNGSGKSTLFKILFGTLAAERKFIRMNGQVMNSPYTVPDTIGYLPQHEFLPKHLSAEKVVQLFLGKPLVEVFFNDENLKKLRKSKASTLSGGELRYMEIKLLLNSKAKFVLLDEPFNGISPLMIETIKPLITEASQTKGILLTDHDYRNVMDVANSYRLLFDGGIKHIKNQEDLMRWGYIVSNNASED